MEEVGIGVLFAAWFVTAYLLIARLRATHGPHAITFWRNRSQTSFGNTQLSGGERPQLFLTTEALSRHHSRHGRQQSDQAEASQAAAPKQRP